MSIRNTFFTIYRRRRFQLFQKTSFQVFASIPSRNTNNQNQQNWYEWSLKDTLPVILVATVGGLTFAYLESEEYFKSSEYKIKVAADKICEGWKPVLLPCEYISRPRLEKKLLTPLKRECVHVLVGEKGAGKTTLLQKLFKGKKGLVHSLLFFISFQYFLIISFIL